MLAFVHSGNADSLTHQLLPRLLGLGGKGQKMHYNKCQIIDEALPPHLCHRWILVCVWGEVGCAHTHCLPLLVLEIPDLKITRSLDLTTLLSELPLPAWASTSLFVMEQLSCWLSFDISSNSVFIGNIVLAGLDIRLVIKQHTVSILAFMLAGES